MCGFYVSQVRDEVLSFLESVRYKEQGWGKWKYNVKMERAYGLIPSIQAITILQQLKALEGISSKHKNDAKVFFQSTQDYKDGYFKDPLVKQTDRVTKPLNSHDALHSWEDIWGQMSATANALDILGAKPLYPLPKSSFVNLEKVNIREWVLSLNWKQPWHVGERFYRSIDAYIRKEKNNCKLYTPSNDLILHKLFDTYEKEVLDKDSGMPIKKGCVNSSVAMAGLFKIMHAYKIANKETPYAKHAIDFTLNLQHSDGEFGIGRQMTIICDALWILRELNNQLKDKYRYKDIVAAGNLTAKLLFDVYQKPDGGFAFCGEYCWPVHHSIRISQPYPIGDVTGTSLSLKCLEYADEWNKIKK